MLLKVYKQHPKKTLLLLMALFGFVTFKFRNELFQKFIEKLQGKLTRDMKIQMDKSEKINLNLEKIKQIVEAFYQSQAYRVISKKTFQFEQLNEAGKKLQQKNPILSNQQKQEIYQEMTNSFLMFDLSTLLLLRYFECALLLPKILMITIPIEMEILFIQNLLDDIQEKILIKQYNLIVQRIEIKQKREQDKFKYNSKNNLNDFLKQLIIECQEILLQKQYWNEIIKEIQQFKKEKLIQLQQYNEGILDIKIIEQVDNLTNQLLEINKSNVMITFLQYSINFSYQKLQNRMNLLPNLNELQNDILLKQFTMIHRIILQEYYDENSNNQHLLYYQKIISQAGKIKENQEIDENEKNNMKQILKVLHESKLCELLQTSQNQIIRKIIFGKEFGETTSSQESSLGGLFKQL